MAGKNEGDGKGLDIRSVPPVESERRVRGVDESPVGLRRAMHIRVWSPVRARTSPTVIGLPIDVNPG